MLELRSVLAFQLGNDALGQHFAQFDPPLVEGIDPPNGALRENTVLVERNELAERFWIDHLRQDGVGRTVALENAMRDKVFARSLGTNLFGCLPEGQGLRLGKHVGQKNVMVATDRVERFGKTDKIARDQVRALVDELVEGVLTVRARLAPVNGAGIVIDVMSVERDALAIAFHGQLLEVGREALEILFVRQHRRRLGVEKISVPDGEKSHQNRQVFPERRGAEMFVHLMETGEHGVEVVRTNRHHGRQADGRIHRVAAPHPIPESEHICRIDAELADLLRIGRHGDKMPGHAALITTQTGHHPIARGARIGHGFQRGESFRGNDEQRLGRFKSAHRLGKIVTVHIRDEFASQGAVAVKFQRFIGHDRPEIGTADADVDHVADLPAGVSDPCSGAETPGKIRHFVQNLVHTRHHVLAVDHDFLPARGAQRNVEHSAIFRGVDLLPAEHRVDAAPQSALRGEGNEQFERAAGHPVLRIVEIKPAGLGGEAVSALRVGRKKLAQMKAGDLGMVGLKCLPGGGVGQGRGAHGRRPRKQRSGRR